MKEKREPRAIKCPKCGYEWDTRTAMYYVTCPKCAAKIRVPEVAE